jgi:imidazolonepropionase-like amidohydrolase
MRLAAVAVAFGCAFALTGVASPAARSPASITLSGGTVINPRDGRIIPNATVVIRGDTIESVAPASEAKTPAGTETVDCAGKFILPGYIDTHVHFIRRPVHSARRDRSE